MGLVASSGAISAPRPDCLDDAKRFCGSVIQNEEARRACMRSHAADLSAECRAAIVAQPPSGKADLNTCRRLANAKYHVQDGRMLNRAVGYAVQRCMKDGPSAL